MKMVLHRLIRFLFPDLTMTRPESIEAIARLQYKINAYRKEINFWRSRCVGVEDLYCDQIRRMKDATKNHTGLHWRNL